MSFDVHERGNDIGSAALFILHDTAEDSLG